MWHHRTAIDGYCPVDGVRAPSGKAIDSVVVMRLVGEAHLRRGTVTRDTSGAVARRERAAWFAELPTPHYAVNRAVDAVLRGFGYEQLETLLTTAGVLRPGRILKIVRDTVEQARARWRRLLVDAPNNLRASVEERLGGGVARSRRT